MPKSRSKSKNPDAIELLKQDHDKVEKAFKQFEKMDREDEEACAELVRTVCEDLKVHTTLEEEIFYPAARDAIDDDDILNEFVEHDGAKVLIAEIEASGPEDEFYDAKVTVLSEMIEHHVEEEEKRAEGLFAEAKDAGLDMDALGEQMAARKQELMAEFKNSDLPPPQTRSFHGHELQQGEPVSQAA